MCFDDVAAVQEGHLAVGLHPELVPCVLGEDGECSDVQTELGCLGELAYGRVMRLARDFEGRDGGLRTQANAQGEKLITGY